MIFWLKLKLCTVFSCFFTQICIYKKFVQVFFFKKNKNGAEKLQN